MFKQVLGESILKRAQEKDLVSISVINLRDFTTDKHRKADDRPFGGGPGMVMKPEPIFRAVESLTGSRSMLKEKNKQRRIILMAPQGKPLDYAVAERFLRYEHLILICGHYEGIDERVRKALVTDEISIGDYVLSGGELAAMVFMDVVIRLIPGVLGDPGSLEWESFSKGLLEYPQYTRPADFRGMKVPKVLLSGNHGVIEKWRILQAIARTKKSRKDLIVNNEKTFSG